MPDNWDKFERLGEEKVRRLLANGGLRSDRRGPAREWLVYLEQKRVEEAGSDQHALAKSTTEAAWISAGASIDAAKSARNSNYIALAALVVSVITLIVVGWQSF